MTSGGEVIDMEVMHPIMINQCEVVYPVNSKIESWTMCVWIENLAVCK